MKMKNLMENQNYSSIFIALSRCTDAKTFQSRIEKNLVMKNFNNLQAIQGTTCLVVVDDINLSVEGVSPVGVLRSFYEHRGWYSNCNKKYL